MECTSLGQLTSQAPGTETGNRNQEELETIENKGTRSAVAKKMWFVGLFNALQEPGVRADLSICLPVSLRQGRDPSTEEKRHQ